jgi:hypothetical protein
MEEKEVMICRKKLGTMLMRMTRKWRTKLRRPNEKVDLYDDEGDRRSDSSLSMTTKVKNVEEGKSPNFGKKKHKEVGILEEIEEANGNRFSNRLAPKSDVPIMDRAKKIAMQKNL